MNLPKEHRAQRGSTEGLSKTVQDLERTELFRFKFCPTNDSDPAWPGPRSVVAGAGFEPATFGL